MSSALEVDWQGIKALATNGQTLKQISEATGISLGTLKARSSREEWYGPLKAARKLIESKQAAQIQKGQMKAIATDATVALSDTLAEDAKATRLHLSAAARKGAKAASEMEGLDVVASSDKILNVGKLASLTHGWNEQGSGSVAVNLLCQNVENLQINARS